jgi:hypothetical protein
MTEDSNNAVSSSFLLDDDSRLFSGPGSAISLSQLFHVSDLTLSMILQTTAFHFRWMTSQSQ